MTRDHQSHTRKARSAIINEKHGQREIDDIVIPGPTGCISGTDAGRKKFNTRMRMICASTYFAITLPDKCTVSDWWDQKKETTHLSFGCVAVETRLSGAVSPSLAMVRVEGELEIHHFAFKVQRGRFIAGGRGRVRRHSSKK